MSAEQFRNIVRVKKPIRQIEGAAQRTFGQLLNFAYRPRLSRNLSWWSYSGAGERKSLKTGGLQKTKGMQKGKPDYEFYLIENGLLYAVFVEFKTSSGSLTVEQKEFFKRHEGLRNVKCYIARSAEEGIEILFKEKILL